MGAGLMAWSSCSDGYARYSFQTPILHCKLIARLLCGAGAGEVKRQLHRGGPALHRCSAEHENQPFAEHNAAENQ